MIYEGTAQCNLHGKFNWRIVEAEKNRAIFGINLNTMHVKTYDKKLNYVCANCPVCGKRIEIEYIFKKEC